LANVEKMEWDRKNIGTKFSRFFLIVFVNGIVFLVLFIAAEISCRVYKDGFIKAVAGIIHFFNEVPYSNLGTSDWVIFDEELGYRLNPMKEKYNNFSIRHGEIAIPKPEGVHRIIYLGDSIPWDGNGFVKQTKDFMEEKGQFEIINAAVPGYTSYQEVLFYKKYIEATTPDLVIWTYCLNDNHKFLHRFDEKARMLWTEEAERTLRMNTSLGRIVSRSYLLTKLYLGIISRIKQKTDSKYKFVWEKKVDFNIAWKDQSWIDYENHLIELKKVLDNQNAKLAIIIFPYEPQLLYRNDLENYDYVVKPQRKLQALCKKYHIPCLDLYQRFAEEYSRNKKLYRDGIHLNSEGHKLTTQQVLHFLFENRLLSF
jgi:GDSL-like Lipase/Acylhydrolase family